MQTHLAGTPLRTRAYRGWIAFGLFLLGVSWFYYWVPAAFREHSVVSRPEGYYNELSDAFLAGRTSLLRLPDKGLVALANPYDPALNAPYRVNDLSYFKGRYYLYMGPAPALAVFLPFRALTGHYLAEKAAASFLGVLGVAASVGLLWRIKRFSLPRASTTSFVCAAFSLALADGYYVAARGMIAQQVAVMNGYAFGMIALMACGFALTSARYVRLWFGLASLSLGIAIASRPNYVFASVALIPPFLFWARKNRSKEIWKTAAAATVPLGTVVALLLAYNWTRFGNFFDFGQRYQLGAWNQLNLSSTGLAHGWENTWRYLFAPALYSPYFPFVTAPTWIAVSALPHVPWLWLLPVAGYVLFRKSAPGPVRALGASALLLGVTNLLTLIFLPSGNPQAVLTSANARYILDFLPAFILFAGLGIVAAPIPDGPGSRFGRTAWSVIVAGLCIASAIIALSLDIGSFPSASYRPLAYVLNFPEYVLERVRGSEYGPEGIDLVLPADKTGAYEPLVSCGTAGSSDLLYVNYTSSTQARFGFVSTDLIGPLSEPVTVSYGKPLHLEVSMGSLYPPDGHPSWLRYTERQVAYLRRRLLVVSAGETVLDVQAHFDPALPDQVKVGENPFLQSYASALFSGKILGTQRLPVASVVPRELPAPSFGSVRMTIRLPEQRRLNAREPLVTTGVPRAGDIFYVQYLPDDNIAFGVDHWGGAGFKTEPFSAKGAEHIIEVSIGSLFPVGPHGSERQHARVYVDGAAVFDGEQDTYDSLPYDVTIGTNAIGGSTCAYAFTGHILKVERIYAGK